MAENVKLKDLYGDAKTYSGVDVVYLPDADNEKEIKVYTKRTVRQYSLHSSPTFEPIIPDAASGTFINDAAPGAVMEYPNGHYVGLAEDLNVIGGVANPNQDAGTAHSVIEIIITNPATRLLYTYENISSENLKKLPLLTSTILGTATFTVTPGWSKAIFNADNEIVSFEHLDDVSNVVFDVKFPTTTFVDDMVNAVMYEASQETKSITVTQNGTSSIVPSKGKSGIAQLNLEVNVAGGGGTGVQPDYAQNNTTAADYIKNRPGGYMVETPSVSKTMTAADYRSDNPEMGALYKFSDMVPPDEAIVGGTGKITTLGSDGVATEHDISSILPFGELAGMRAYGAYITGSEDPLQIVVGSVPEFGIDGTYFQATLHDGTVTAYISQFTTAAVSEPAVIDEKYLALKPSNWGVPSKESGNGYISSRIGGFWESGKSPWQFDGDLNGKDVVDVSDSYKFVKISDDAVPLDYAARGYISHQDLGSDTYTSDPLSRSNITILPNGGGFVIMAEVFPGVPSGQTQNLVISAQIPYVMMEEVKFTQGTWFLYRAGSGDTPAHYISGISSGANDDIVRMPYEFVEQNPSTLTTDAQTLTDAQKLQARTNIGTVEGTDKEMILSSSTAGSAKKFKITVTDDGTLTATEVTQ